MIALVAGASLPVLIIADICILAAGTLFYIRERLSEDDKNGW